ncbi:MAG: hypothetical protein GY873_00625 [Bosea sp.]|uniref:hypothetical protein n=1 Tax=Bosea sp. (in: a-proteobacteria) TaxID=1871050 RepID=UPI0023857E76|nr:hypothetical protein [Bosea sp. (in: a-proteobacteria)]MCP4732675.1 hypothetical protein [Bosea sp. (in: a-proteobacteria)]
MYITARIRAEKTYHGYDENRQMIVDDNVRDDFVEKVIRLDRILSFTDKYIFIECPHNTVQTWEYEGSLEEIKAQLREVGLLLG